MRRLIVSAVLLAGFVSLGKADYVLIKYTIGGKKKDDASGGGSTQPAPPGGNPQSGDPETKGLDCYAIVEGKVTQVNMAVRVKASLKHRFGLTNLYSDDQIKVVPVSGLIVPTVKARFANEERKVTDRRTPDKELGLAEFALNLGLIDEFQNLMDGLSRVHKTTGNKAYDDAMTAYPKTRDAIGKRIDREDSTTYWRTKTGFRMSQTDHYSLLYNASGEPPEVRRRLDLLESNFKQFYYWFALKGHALPMPEQKLVAVMFDQPDQFIVQRAIIEDEPLSTDGFFSTRDNVLVFSTQRLDEPFMALSRQMQAHFQNWDFGDLLKGKAAPRRAQVSVDEQYMIQTLALLYRAQIEEGERAAVSAEASRQLLVACGMQKPSVVMPRWAQFGIGSVFETAKGPFPLAPQEVSVAYWPSFAAASWAYTRIFHEFLKIDPKPDAAQTLRAVVTDQVFHAVASPLDLQGLVRARTLSWGLCYYLAKTRISGVIRFYEETATLPHDLELAPREVLACFARAFDLANPSGTDIDPAKFAEFAKGWFAFMQTITPPGAEYKLGVEPTPGGPGGPGGPPPKGGGSKGGGPQPKGP